MFSKEHCEDAEKSVINTILLLNVTGGLAHHNDWSRWFAISSPPHVFALPVSVLRVELKKVDN